MLKLIHLLCPTYERTPFYTGRSLVSGLPMLNEDVEKLATKCENIKLRLKSPQVTSSHLKSQVFKDWEQTCSYRARWNCTGS